MECIISHNIFSAGRGIVALRCFFGGKLARNGHGAGSEVQQRCHGGAERGVGVGFFGFGARVGWDGTETEKKKQNSFGFHTAWPGGGNALAAELAAVIEAVLGSGARGYCENCNNSHVEPFPGAFNCCFVRKRARPSLRKPDLDAGFWEAEENGPLAPRGLCFLGQLYNSGYVLRERFAAFFFFFSL